MNSHYTVRVCVIDGHSPKRTNMESGLKGQVSNMTFLESLIVLLVLLILIKRH